MLSEDKVTEIFCLADEFCNFFDTQQEKSMLTAPQDGKKHRRKPNRMSTRPLVISDSSEIGIRVRSRSGNYLIALDGRNESCEEATTITVRKADYKQLIIRRREHTFIQNLKEKLMWGTDVRE